MKPLTALILSGLLYLVLQPLVINWAQSFEQKTEMKIYIAIIFGQLTGVLTGILMAKNPSKWPLILLIVVASIIITDIRSAQDFLGFTVPGIINFLLLFSFIRFIQSNRKPGNHR